MAKTFETCERRDCVNYSMAQLIGHYHVEGVSGSSNIARCLFCEHRKQTDLYVQKEVQNG